MQNYMQQWSLPSDLKDHYKTIKKRWNYTVSIEGVSIALLSFHEETK
jgi:hypothetical protein